MPVSPSNADKPDKPVEPWGDPSLRPTSARGLGLRIGAIISVVFLGAVLLNPSIWRDPYEDARVGWVGLTLLFSALAVPVVGYLTAAVLTRRHATTRLGQGMLIGLTVTMPAAVLFMFGVVMSRSA
jgi:hypothetical protein